MRIRGSLLLTALALLGLVAAACRGGATAELPAAAGEGPRVGDPAPAFSLLFGSGPDRLAGGGPRPKAGAPVLQHGFDLSWLHAAGS